MPDDTDRRYPTHPTHREGRSNRPDPRRKPPRSDEPPAGARGPGRAARAGAESFKCVHCKAFIGPTVSGGRHRNHCPRCLYSRHVDVTIGDRAAACKSSMAPVGRFERPNGEPVMVHRCLGCGLERHNRLAADDDWELFLSLPEVSPRLGVSGTPASADEKRDTERTVEGGL